MGSYNTQDMLSVEVLSSYRSMKERIAKHPVMTTWFILLLIIGFSATLLVSEYVISLEIEILLLSRADILFVIFFFFMGKASSETLDNVLKNKRLKHLFTSPVNVQRIRDTFFMKIIWYNLLLLAISVSLAGSLIHLLNIGLNIDGFFFLHLYLVVIAAVIIGFNIALLSRVANKIYRYIALFIYGQNITAIWYVLNNSNNFENASLMLFGIVLLSVLVYHTTTQLFLDSWVSESSRSVSSDVHIKGKNPILSKCTSKAVCSVTEKEILDRWRSKETKASVSIVAVIGIGLLFMFYQLGPDPDLGLGLEEFFYPIFIGMSVFLAVSLQIVIPSLTLFGREGKRLWAMKVLPIKPRDVVYGKLISMMVFSPMILISIALPLPIILGYPITHVLFILFSTAALIFVSSGIAIWAAARFPNFDESVNGAPDVMTMYIVMMSCLILGGMLVLPSLAVFMQDNILGLFLIVLSADMGALITIQLAKEASKLYDRIQLDM